MDEFKEILASDATDVDKLTQMFDWVTGRIVEHSQMDVDMARAMNDKDELVKQQIKLSTIKHARSIFNMCYQQVTGEKAWHE
jgi:hypothetical protein